VGQPGDGDTEGAEPLGEVVGGGLALDVGVGGHDDLLDLSPAHPLDQLGDAQLLGADAVDRRDGALEDVVEAAELAAALDGQDVERLLDDAELGGVAARVAADAAEVALGDEEAAAAGADLVAQVEQRGAEALDLVARCAHAVEGEALRRLGPDAGELAQLGGEPFQAGGDEAHGGGWGAVVPAARGAAGEWLRAGPEAGRARR
jgi:hypothetical protein